MGARLQRHLGPVQSLLPGQWTAETASGKEALCCPSCGHIADIEYPHEVEKYGRVKFRWACPSQSCSFAEFLILEAHNEEVLR